MSAKYAFIDAEKADLETKIITGTVEAVEVPSMVMMCSWLKVSRSGFQGQWGRVLLAGWLSWARPSRIPAFVKLAKTIERHRQLILNTLDHGMSNAKSEATNTHLRVLTRRAYGYHSLDALIAMAMLTRGGLCPQLPGRNQ